MFRSLCSTYLAIIPSEQAWSAQSRVTILNSLIIHSGNPSSLADAIYLQLCTTFAEDFCLSSFFPELSLTHSFKSKCDVLPQPALARLERLIPPHLYPFTHQNFISKIRSILL